MGCFDKTCCLSNTAISAGEECLIIILNEDSHGFTNTFYHLSSDLWKQSRRESQELSDRELGMLADFKYKKGDLLPFRDAIVGTYNDYGSIEEEDRLPEDYEEIRMDVQIYHVWAVEFLLKKPIAELMENKVRMVSNLYSAMYYLRKSPLDLKLSGQQHKDRKEILAMISFNNRVNEYLTAKLEDYDEYEDED